jgi:hypothetical protein
MVVLVLHAVILILCTIQRNFRIYFALYVCCAVVHSFKIFFDFSLSRLPSVNIQEYQVYLVHTISMITVKRTSQQRALENRLL